LSSPTRIAFVTYEGLPELNADDRRAAAALDELGLPTDAVCWDDPRVDWLGYGAVILRSTWDYHRRVAEFHAWIDRMEAIGTRLWNPPRVLRWNTDKRYLTRIAHPSLAPPPTEIFQRGSAVNLPALLEARGWSEAVVKPAISADGFSTERTSRDSAESDQAVFDAMLGRGDVVIQRLVPEIRTNGEISMMFVDFPSGLPHVKSGAVRALAVTTAARSALVPDVPSMKEVGIDFDMASWNAIFAPAGTPKPIVSRLNKELREIVADPVVYARLRSFGFDAFTGKAQEDDALAELRRQG
jgi:hypothetical protein